MTDTITSSAPPVCPYGFRAKELPAAKDEAPLVAPKPLDPQPHGISITADMVVPSESQPAPKSGCPLSRAARAVAGFAGKAVHAGSMGVDAQALHAKLEERGGSKPFTQQPSFAETVKIFAGPTGPTVDFPPDIAQVVASIATWNTRAQALFAKADERSVFRNTVETGAVIADALRLVRTTNTKRIDEWLISPATPDDKKVAFEAWRDACLQRTDALSALASEALVTGNLMGWEDSPLKALVVNMSKLSKMMGGKGYLWDRAGVAAGLACVSIRERQYLSAVAGVQMRRNNVPFSRCGQARMLDRLNDLAGRPMITGRHAEVVRDAYAVLKEHGVTGDAAHALLVTAMREGQRAAGKPWKGILRMTEMVRYSGCDPAAEGFVELFKSAMAAPVHYTHVPGIEWIVRDPVLGLRLLQMDGLIPPGQDVADLRQGQNSLIPGLFRSGVAKTKVAERYSRSLDAFLDSMVVAEGADHKRHRKAFLSFFTKRAVLEHAPYVEQTVTNLLDQTEAIVRDNGGSFDFKKDFAYHFPIRIICRMIGLPESDVPMVQRWAEQSVRAMDIGAGMTMEIANQGQRSAAEFRTYLEGKLEAARRGEIEHGMITAVANDPTLSENERIANIGVMIFAGFETTTGLLAKGMNELLRHPAQWQYLRDSLVQGEPVVVDGKPVPDHDLRWLAWAETQRRDVDEVRRAALLALVEKSEPLRVRYEATKVQETRLDNAVEELLRWNAPGSVIPLTASRDLEVELPSAMFIRGRAYAAGDKLKFRKGENIAVPIDELNRRAEIGPGSFDTDARGDFDISRAENPGHLSFGVRHQCIGAFLAKENAKRALDGVLRRFPTLTLDGQPVPQDMELFSGLASLPVRVA